MALFPDRLYLELAYHGRPTEKLINHGLVVVSERLELPLVATNAVRFARPEDALAHAVLEAMAQGRTTDGLLVSSGRRESDLPQVALEATRAQAYLKSPQEMARLFSKLPTALEATIEIARRCTFRLPLAAATPPERRYGPALLFGLEPVRGMAQDELL